MISENFSGISAYPLLGILASLAVEESVLNYAEKQGHLHPQAQRKMEAHWLKSQGVGHSENQSVDRDRYHDLNQHTVEEVCSIARVLAQSGPRW